MNTIETESMKTEQYPYVTLTSWDEFNGPLQWLVALGPEDETWMVEANTKADALQIAQLKSQLRKLRAPHRICATQSKATPGPWKVLRERDDHGRHRIFIGLKGLTVAEVPAGLPQEEEDANAQLLSQAPQLLAQRNELREALEKLAGWFHTELPNGAFSSAEHLMSGCANELKGNIDQARAALANTKD